VSRSRSNRTKNEKCRTAMKEEERSRLYARAKATAGKDDMVSCIMKNFYHFSKRLYIMSCRDMICRQMEILMLPPRAELWKIFENMLSCISKQFMMKRIPGLLNMETKCNGLQCQTHFADIVRELIHVTFSIADSLYEIGKGKSGPRM